MIRLKPVRAQVAEALAKFPGGATAHEIAAAMCQHYNTIQPTLTLMRQDGQITIAGSARNAQRRPVRLYKLPEAAHAT